MGMTRRILGLGLACAVALGCAKAQLAPAAAPMVMEAAAEMEAPTLERSVFSTASTGALTEDDLQQVLDSWIDVEFPARLGVVALGDAFRAEAVASIGEQATIAEELSERLEGSSHFTHVTDISTELPNPRGIEGLRTIAARYRVRYLMVCSLHTERDRHMNNWAWLYPTGAGLLLAPGVTVSSGGYMQASLLDVSTGTVLFTINEPFQTTGTFWLVGANRHHRELDAEELILVARHLSDTVVTEMDQLETWIARENENRHAAARAGRATPLVAQPEPAADPSVRMADDE